MVPMPTMPRVAPETSVPSQSASKCCVLGETAIWWPWGRREREKGQAEAALAPACFACSQQRAGLKLCRSRERPCAPAAVWHLAVASCSGWKLPASLWQSKAEAATSLCCAPDSCPHPLGTVPLKCSSATQPLTPFHQQGLGSWQCHRGHLHCKCKHVVQLVRQGQNHPAPSLAKRRFPAVLQVLA